MLIGQISDSHMLPPGETNHAEIDPAARLKAAVDAMNHANPDLVLHTGDIAHHGTPEAYALAKEILEKLEAPIYLIPGNHDDRASMRSVFSSENWMPDKKTPSAFIHYEIDADPLHIIMLDSLLPGQVGGQLCDDRLEFLAKQLDHDTRPTIIAIHHPPMAPGLGGFAKIGLEGADKLAEIVSRRQQVIRIIAGHNHRSVMGVCGGVPAVVAPSCAFPFAFNTNKDASISIAFEPPGAALHIWEKGEGLVSHTISIGDWPHPRALR
jgi:Icc protein